MSDYLTPIIDSNNPHPIYPNDRVPGCQRRKTAFGKAFRLASDQIKIIPSSQWDDYTGSISLRPMVRTILDQDGIGSCATEATAQALMVARTFAGLPHIALNPWFIYHTTSGGVDRGSSIDENLQFVMQNGCAPEEIWPRSKGWRAKPSEEAVEAALTFRNIEVYDIGSINEMVSALLTGFAVVYGSKGHAVLKVEHIDKSKGLDVNSWGETWGDNGFGVWASYRSVDFSYGAYAVRAIREAE